MDTPEAPRRQQWTIFVDNATPDLSTETVAAAVMFLAGRTDSGGLPPRVHVIAEDVADLVYVDGVGWVCPACWASSDRTYTGTLSYVETVGEARHVDLAASTPTMLSVYDATTEGWDEGTLDPRIWCSSCLTRYALPDGIDLDWN
jgi:hypothetical protein